MKAYSQKQRCLALRYNQYSLRSATILLFSAKAGFSTLAPVILKSSALIAERNVNKKKFYRNETSYRVQFLFSVHS